MTEYNFLNNDTADVFTFGTQPVAIDMMTRIKGADFKELFEASTQYSIDGLMINLIQFNHLLHLKKVAGRHKDLDDIENLTATNNQFYADNNRTTHH